MPSPTTEEELSGIIAGAEGPFRILGGGTRPIGRPVQGTPLSVAGLSGITLYEPGALTMVVRAGTPLDQIEAALWAENQRLPFEPMDHRPLLGTSGTPTIGGVIAGNISGPRRVQAGAARDYMLGVRFVDGAGRILKNGGRVMKNVTGYDLVKLMTGSWGTLGVMTEVSLKVLPRPGAAATLSLTGLDDATAVRAMAAALGSPFDVSGVAHDPAAGETLIRVEGFATSVAYRAGRLSELLAPFGAANVSDDVEGVRARWREIRDVQTMAGQPGDVWRLSVKPSDAPGIVARAGAEQVLYDWGGGLVWLRLAEGTDLRARLGAFGGHATLIRASAETRAAIAPFHPDPAPVAALSEGLRKRFDPKEVLNPRLML
ncbi:FAD-binding protein [Loktanella sp. IMCC34160]|uniref:FAD-binding protein n=1 Tax=Loktanella sp. IMCC34160 TaxID=2510646 RepID=UPI00101C352B|nr:FAD-binding protein [Loktanella sp. IMCC34160]RYG92982.1 FAD-binding protein [Loktanella sp. IMCC34160]